MIAYGVCVRTNDHFDRCVAGISTHGGSDATLVTSDDPGLAAAYNQILDAVAAMDAVEAVALVDEGTEILDADFVTKALAALRDGADVVGVLGASGGAGLEWWDWSRRYGGLRTPNGVVRHDAGTAGVDAVDGTCMVLSPAALAALRFDDVNFSGEHGYDIDLCFQARALGMRIDVLDVEVLRHGGGARDSGSGMERARANFDAKWSSLRDRAPSPEHDQASSPADHGAAGEATTSPTAGTKNSDEAPAGYYGYERPELLALVSESARRVLDVGCGSGALGAALKRRLPDCEVSGLEYVQEAVDEAAQRLDRAIRVDLNSDFELPLPPGYFDTIICGDVLEHLLDPEASLRRLLPYLHENGAVVSSIPNVKHWSVLIPALAHDRWEYSDEGLLDRTHVHLFTLHEARLMFDQVGLVNLAHAGANRIPLEPADALEPLVQAAAAYGADADTARELLNCYQYLLVTKRN